MILLVAGSRDRITWAQVEYEMHCWMEANGRPDKVIHGACRGVDQFAGAYAKKLGIPVQEFPADWKRHGKAAGPMRNAVMAQVATHALVLHRGTRGSLDMLRRARNAGLVVTDRNFEWRDKTRAIATSGLGLPK